MIANIKCLSLACDFLGIYYKFLDENQNFIKVLINNKSYHFINCLTPFNTEDIVKISRDKYFTYLSVKDFIKTPKSINFLDPEIDNQYQEYIKENNYIEITNKIINEFQFPVVIKRNSGFKGINVFKCSSKEDVEKAIQKIFNHNSKNYDFAAIAQEYVNIKKEYRVIIFKGEILLCYRKYFYKTLTNTDTLNKISNFIKPIYENLDLNFAGLDIAIDKNDKLWLIEINTAPGLEKYYRKNGNKEVINLYKKILQNLS